LSWAIVDDILQFSGRLYIPPTSPLLQELLAAIHEDGHEGMQHTLHHLQRDFHFPNMRRYKSEHLHPAGLLMPLPVPQGVWTDVALDFVEGLPKLRGKMVILTMVDRLSKYCHIVPLAHPYSAKSVAQAFFADIVRLHGVPKSLVSDRDLVFTSKFWKELMHLSGTKLHMTTAFHPQSDSQSESSNRVIVMYLCCLTGDRPLQWLQWLPWAEYTFNTAYHSSLRDTPFRVVYGRDPPSIRSYEPGETPVAASPRPCRSGMSSWRISAPGSSKLRRSRSATTTRVTGRCPIRWGTGRFSDSVSARWRLSRSLRQAS
jgi:hypothetical protein